MKLFSFFESFVDPFPAELSGKPPNKLIPFLWHYSKSVWPWLLVLAVITSLISIVEVSLFGYLGNLIDWLGTSEPSAFIQNEHATLWWIGALIVVVLPLLMLFHALVVHQTLLGNYPMLIRWQMHRYMLNQSYSFFQDEFAGRVATKVMQSSLSIREAVMKVLDTMVYVGVYFVGALVLMASLDVWLMVPFIAWLALYVLLLRYFLPKLKAISRRQADARSEMTGRVVDSYTNIQAVKLFAHSGREAQYAKHSMKLFLDTVHPQMRLSTSLTFSLTFINGLLLFAIGAVSISLWLDGVVNVGAVAVGVGLAMRLQGMSQWIMWELSHLFESVGVVYDGMGMLSKDVMVNDISNANEINIHSGEIEFKEVSFHYGKETASAHLSAPMPRQKRCRARPGR